MIWNIFRKIYARIEKFFESLPALSKLPFLFQKKKSIGDNELLDGLKLFLLEIGAGEGRFDALPMHQKLPEFPQ